MQNLKKSKWYAMSDKILQHANQKVEFSLFANGKSLNGKKHFSSFYSLFVPFSD